MPIEARRRKPQPSVDAGVAVEPANPTALPVEIGTVEPVSAAPHDEGCPIIYADTICFGSSRLGMVRVAFFAATDRSTTA